MKHYSLFLIYCSLFVVLISGCGKNVGLKGRVLLSDDKSPLTQGVICFEKDGYIARGPIDKSGNYVVGAEKNGGGLERGEYKIYFQNTERVTYPTDNTVASLPKIENIIDPKYNKADTSGLTLDVRKSQTFDIEVDRFQKK
ncbi:MAG: hypothetical protein LBN39_07760 [Planctomycetaceae bacterium]|jgi:hypothetical protein|nr:hypothetical protein [Planctomycetaceae bacterium]